MTGSTKSDQRNLVLEEHRELTAHLNELEQWVAPTTASGADWAPELKRRVSVVLEQLKMHFAGDAEGNLFAEVSVSRPHLAGRLSALAAEHSQILKAFREVAEGAAALQSGDEAARLRLGLKAQAALATLRRHEAEENEIIMRAFWEDLGAAD